MKSRKTFCKKVFRITLDIDTHGTEALIAYFNSLDMLHIHLIGHRVDFTKKGYHMIFYCYGDSNIEKAVRMFYDDRRRVILDEGRPENMRDTLWSFKADFSVYKDVDITRSSMSI